MNIPQGYRFSGIHCGIKTDTSVFDLSLIVSDVPATAAGVYTQNLVCGAPVQVDRSRTPGSGFQAVVINSRCANACTGPQGVEAATEMAALAAAAVGVTPDKGLVMSTGVIGTQLPMLKVRRGITVATAKLAATPESLRDAARGMMTTDTFEKMASRTVSLPCGTTVTLSGICKGAAMIGPNMATLLSLVITDAALEPAVAQSLLKKAADLSFNCISVEGHTSTSDTLLFLANGAAKSTPLTSAAELDVFETALVSLCTELAKMIPADGEGCSHVITIDVKGCATKDDATKIAKRIANDALVKTAICGADPNWGRIVSAAGTAGVEFCPTKVSLKVNGYELYREGVPLPFDKESVSQAIRNQRDTLFEIQFGEGTAGATFWTTDLTAEYVRLNADYTT